MAGYTKLFASIVGSTIWKEPKHVKIVWITMLALKDKYQIVEASVPGLAGFAGVTLDECVEALNILSSPDPFSRTKEFEGRRIREVDGGWEILNGEKYREMMNEDERREKNRIYQKRHRDRQRKRNEAAAAESAQHPTGEPQPGEGLVERGADPGEVADMVNRERLNKGLADGSLETHGFGHWCDNPNCKTCRPAENSDPII